nr:DUF6516 family protein [Candidatus Sigynarchaeota archaeon]
MTDIITKLERTKSIIEIQLKDMLIGINLEAQYPRLVASFRDGIVLYIRYNDHNQYSYSILFSGSELDRCRFDNFDDKWNVPSKPHHFHPRSLKQGFKSQMSGDPDKDMVILCQAMKKGVLYSKNCRF